MNPTTEALQQLLPVFAMLDATLGLFVALAIIVLIFGSMTFVVNYTTFQRWSEEQCHREANVASAARSDFQDAGVGGITRMLDDGYKRLWRLPECAPGACFCRRGCSAMMQDATAVQAERGE